MNLADAKSLETADLVTQFKRLLATDNETAVALAIQVSQTKAFAAVLQTLLELEPNCSTMRAVLGLAAWLTLPEEFYVCYIHYCMDITTKANSRTFERLLCLFVHKLMEMEPIQNAKLLQNVADFAESQANTPEGCELLKILQNK